MTSLSPLDRDILFLMFIGNDLSADHLLPLGQRYQLAGRSLPAAHIRALQICGLIRSTGKHDQCEGFEITMQGRVAITTPARPSAFRPTFKDATRGDVPQPRPE